MSIGESTYDRINDYTSVKISLARPHDIRSWSFGEVKKPETINYRTYRPEKDGLFCERIFGPEKDWECSCGKYRGMKYKGMICDRCGVKITHSRVRRKRMGHIELAAPVVHIWFFKAMPSRLGALLAMKTTSLEKVVYFQDYVVTNPGDTALKLGQLLTEEEYRAARAQFPTGWEADMGAEAVRKLLVGLDLVKLSVDLRAELIETNSKQKKKDLINRLKIVEAIRDSDNRPEWMVLDVIPVIPPDLRPLVLLDSGNFATSDLNDLYRRIINRNNRLKKLVDLNAPEVIIRNEKRMLQQSVDALFDNNRCKRPVLGSSNRPLKSLTDMIKGKQGRFRENLLGKRVDYSARSVIVVGPALRLHQCGLPKKIALELYQPFIIRRLKELGHADTIKSAKKMLERKDEEVWDILEEVIQNHPVLLNRAPTLHRMGIQGFEPVLVEGNAIKLHPLVCKGFNADFDGDQMAVHLPLSIEAQVEAHTLLMSTNNIFSPANGAPIISPSQDVVMGCYYMTAPLPADKGDGMKFASVAEVQLAHSLGVVGTHAAITVRLPKGRRVKGDRGAKPGGLLQTTVGRVLFNTMLPEGMPYYNTPLRSSDLAGVISDCYEILGRRKTIDLLDTLNRVGFRQSTLSGLSFATDDLITPPNKSKIIANAEKVVMRILKLYQRGIITEGERYNQVLDAWTHAREQITTEMMQELENDYRFPGYVNPIFLMAHSGARGGVEQIRQLAGMRGLMAKPSGKIIETPIKANFREGLTVLEYFSSTHGARKGLADTALKTADSGYLTRKLADVAQNVVVTTHDCGTTQGITKGVIYRGEKVEVSLADSIKGRVSRANIVNPITDEVLVRENDLITVEIARKIEAMGLEKIQVRSADDLRRPAGRLRLLLRHGPLHRGAGGARHGRGHHRRPEHRRAGHPVDHADLPHRRHRRPRRRRIRNPRQEDRRRPVHPHESRPQRRGPAGRLDPQRRNPPLGPQGPRAGEVRSPRRRQPAGRREPGGPARNRPLPVGPAQHPHPGRGGRKGPLRGRHRRRDHPRRKRPRRPRTQDRHRVQGRPAPANRARRRKRQDSRLLLSARKGQHRGPGGQAPSRPARCWPRPPARSPARRTSPAACRGSRKSSRPANPRTPP